MKRIFVAAIVFVTSYQHVNAQSPNTYQKPPKAIVDLVEAPSSPSVRFTNDGNWMIMLQGQGMPTIAEVAQPELRIAGLRINPARNASSNFSFTSSITLKSVKNGKEYKVSGLPANARIGDITLSPDQKKLAFTNTLHNGVELWVAEMGSQKARKLSATFLNDTYGRVMQWTDDSKHILAKFIPANRGKLPPENPTPSGPVIQESTGKKSPARTYQDLLKNTNDEAMFDYLLTAQLKLVDMTGKTQDIGKPAIIKSFSYSPNGEYLLVEAIHRPYSYLVPASLFPFTVEVLDKTGNPVKTMYDAPLADNLPQGFDAVPVGPRNHGWRNDKPATLFWVEAQDGGNPNERKDIREKVYMLNAPFTGDSTQLAVCYLRFSDIAWGDDGLAIITERWWKTRTERRVFVKPNDKKYRVNLFDRYYEDAYTEPGAFIMQQNEFGRPILLMSGSHPTKGKKIGNLSVFTIGEGSSPQGNRPFLMKTGAYSKVVDTLFHSQSPYYEKPVFFNNEGNVIITRESNVEPPNYVQVDLKKRESTALTTFANPYPLLKGVTKQQLSYKRKDGLQLSAILYTPDGYTATSGYTLPVLMWAYPREYKTADAAGQVRSSPYQFTRISWGSPIYWVTQGYAVMDNTEMPIVGEGNTEPNDTFIEQLKENAEAAIDKVVDMGIGDRRRIAVGGHSYGAFMTVNLLAHTKLFAAGIARSGAYNRTLTPFGFQSEERSYWQVPDLYNKMSPFSYADKIKTPLLMIHGEADNNSGTFPIQSERMYNALKGHGAIARLVFLPSEAHAYRAKESVLHTLWEMDEWLNKYVKNRK